MTDTRREHRQGPPTQLIILLAIFVIGLLLEVGAAFALARLPADASKWSGESRNEQRSDLASTTGDPPVGNPTVKDGHVHP